MRPLRGVQLHVRLQIGGALNDQRQTTHNRPSVQLGQSWSLT